MLKYFDLVLDLLEMEVDMVKYHELATYMSENPTKKYSFFHKHAFLFEAFLALLREEISVETFVKTGDIGAASLWREQSSVALLKAHDDQQFFSKFADSVLVVDAMRGKQNLTFLEAYGDSFSFDFFTL